MTYYPVFLDLRDREVVVIGGGTIAERKVRELLDAGARVRVIGQTLTPALEALVESGQIAFRCGEFEEADLEEAWLVLSTTDDAAVNRRIAEAAARRRLFCNVADAPALCSFLAPAVVRRGDIAIAISTSGKSPALAVHLKQKIASIIGSEYGALAQLLGRMRPFVRERIPDPKQRAEVFRCLIEAQTLELLRAGEQAAAEEHARALVERWAHRDPGMEETS
ncbi:MAG: bifunctional precorrin-2 dehydrogenase/sirohydrochlorin ferrochelatase [Blastocatellia bacterium]|nr:bifunctional precorrin-2 dehydrogenase/sirohydrochlorin ferrochelatase [Blastocatellia bacterium]MCS7158337.1 bifunctional precorrin-2 dehydrogenase/sirohydrochlorin ferrochelatase [Blastocatellia bacterium]MCX7752843.1 bifunctional precorrin-2 dehydrogenase/sirohydrochlorin ferrochelatase [Blastocatellia bacterium]MDW8167899.1 bifunctional precorrin-2 dehydrogenase/sirohydrochlorin ferrochelatase [Acidobacteriota bacterium]MDW8257258.1 bifunctional precorrin-2 dehydrogenase/sirohydrochlorin